MTELRDFFSTDLRIWLTAAGLFCIAAVWVYNKRLEGRVRREIMARADEATARRARDVLDSDRHAEPPPRRPGERREPVFKPGEAAGPVNASASPADNPASADSFA